MDLLECDDTPVTSELFDLEAEIDAVVERQRRAAQAQRELEEVQVRQRLAEQQNRLEGRLARCLSQDLRRALNPVFNGRTASPGLLITYRGDKVALSLSCDEEPSAWRLCAAYRDYRQWWNDYRVDGWQSAVGDDDLQEALLRGLAEMRWVIANRDNEAPF